MHYDMIQAASEIKNKLMLYIPISKTFPAIDAVLVVPDARLVIYAQSTVSKDKGHPIKYQRLKDVDDILMSSEEFAANFRHILLFVVPADVYDRFPAHSYKNTNGKVHRMALEFPVEQWVGKIPKREIKTTQPSDVADRD